MIDATEIGREVRGARIALGLTQARLAERAGVSLPTVQNVEAGRANPAHRTLCRLLDPLGLSLEIGAPRGDWDALSAHGLPLGSGEARPARARAASLVRLVGDAALDLARSAAGPATERRREALQALLLAIRTHFPSFFRRSLGRSPAVRRVLPAEPSGRVLKLGRIARAEVARYL